MERGITKTSFQNASSKPGAAPTTKASNNLVKQS